MISSYLWADVVVFKVVVVGGSVVCNVACGMSVEICCSVHEMKENLSNLLDNC